MKRVFLLVAAAIAAIAFALPATAGAATTFRGVVIAKDSARKSLVTASRNGVVRTVRARGAFKRVNVGRRVAVRAAALPDGTFAASSVKLLGKARRAHFRATVVAHRGARLFVSAGGSVFALRVRSGHKTGASEGSGDLKPGDQVDCDARVGDGSLESRDKDVSKVGHSDQLVLEGIYLATADDGTIELAVVHRGRVFVKVPDDVLVPDFAAGDEVALVVTVDAEGNFTLVKAENENDGNDDDGDVDIDGPKSQFTVAGVLASLDGGYVAVKVEERDKPVRCSVPDGFDLSGFAAGQRVLMACKYNEGNPVLIGLKKKDSETQYLEAVGKITDLADDSITVAGEHGPATCAVGDAPDLSDYAVGDLVVIWCKQIDGVWTLKAIKKKPTEAPPAEYLYVAGTITALDDESVTVQGDGEPVTCAVPDGFDLTGHAVGDHTGMYCMKVDGVWTLKAFKSIT